MRVRMGVYMSLVMRVYVLLMMRVDITVGMCGCMMVMPHMMVSTRGMVMYGGITGVVVVMRMHCMCMVYMVVGVSIGGMVMSIGAMVWSRMVTSVMVGWSRMVTIVNMCIAMMMRGCMVAVIDMTRTR
jgi:hypothetical protein